MMTVVTDSCLQDLQIPSLLREDIARLSAVMIQLQPFLGNLGAGKFVWSACPSRP